MTSSEPAGVPAIAGLRPGEEMALARALIRPEWTNALGHLRAARYVALFDDAIMAFLPQTGLTDRELRHAGTSPFLRDLHATYLRELGAGQCVSITAQVLGCDERRAHVILLMREADSPALVATCELAVLNVDLATRQPAPWSEAQLAVWLALADAHAPLPPPAQAGRAIPPLNRSE